MWLTIKSSGVVRYVLIGLLLPCTAWSLYQAGYRAASRQAEKDQAAIVNTYHAAMLAAEQQYSEKLQAAAEEKQKWYELAQTQGLQLADANRKLDMRSANIEKEMSDVIKKDGSGFNGLGADSVHLYNRAHGYAD